MEGTLQFIAFMPTHLDVRQGVAERGCAPAGQYHCVAAPADQHLPHTLRSVCIPEDPHAGMVECHPHTCWQLALLNKTSFVPAA